MMGGNMVKFLSAFVIALLCQLFLFKQAALSDESYRLGAISVEGNYRISDEAVTNYSRLRVGEIISSANLNDAYKKTVFFFR